MNDTQPDSEPSLRRDSIMVDPLPHSGTTGLASIIREFVLIVAGVLAALAAQAWWQGHEERDRETVYLRQIVSDLHASEEAFTTAAQRTQRAQVAAANVIRAYYNPRAVDRDSLLRWISRAQGFSMPGFGIGSVRALVGSAEIRLIRDDSVRSELMRLVDSAERFAANQRVETDEFYRAATAVNRNINRNELRAQRLSADSIDRRARTDSTFPIPAGTRVHPFPMDVDDLMRNRELYHDMLDLHRSLNTIVLIETTMAGDIRASRERIERLMRKH